VYMINWYASHGASCTCSVWWVQGFWHCQCPRAYPAVSCSILQLAAVQLLQSPANTATSCDMLEGIASASAYTCETCSSSTASAALMQGGDRRGCGQAFAYHAALHAQICVL
jgi:hypothetical protein